jgi:CRP/FNR family cyclic AMP-dependent transcriptional regulator
MYASPSAIVRAMAERPLPRWLAWAADPEQLRRAPFLARSPLFTGLPRRLLARLATRFFEKAYRPGEVVFEEGDPGRALFVVVEGAVEIIRATAQGPYVLNTLGPGDAFGELALIDDFPRSATARVATPGRLLILYKSDFDALMDGNGRIAVVMMRNLSRRLAIYARRPPGVMSGPGPGSETADPL